MIRPSGEILGTVENRVNPVSTRHLELGVQRQRPLEINTDYEGNGTPLQYFCLENPMDGGAW